MLTLSTGSPTSQAVSRVVAVDSFTIKCSTVSSGGGAGSFGVSAGSGNTSLGGGASGPEPLEISDPASFGAGLAERLKSELTNAQFWTVVDRPATADPNATLGTPPAEEPAEGNEFLKPQFLIRATAIDMNVSSAKGGLNVGILGGGQKEVRNKVVIDLKLVDPKTLVILESVRGTGTKSTKSNFLAAFAKEDVEIFGWQQFKESPLSEAADLAIKDGVKKLGDKLAKYPWEATIAAVTTENKKPAYYLSVGKESGLKVGQELELFIPGEPIKDAKSGKVLGKTRPKIIGKVRVVDADSELIVVEPLDQVVIEVGQSVRFVKEEKK